VSGVAVVRYLLANAASVTAYVAAANIRGGVLPLNTTLPGISVMSVDGFPRLTVAMSATKRLMSERVQVTVHAKTYAEKNTIMARVAAAVPLSRGTVNGVLCECVLPDTNGPDLDDPEAQIYTLSRDFIVKWHEG
jgi:hypothetical protein